MHPGAIWTTAIASLAGIDFAIGGAGVSDLGLVAIGAVPVALFGVLALRAEQKRT